MHLKSVRRFALSFLVLSASVAPLNAAPAAAQMYTKGSAKINGVAAPQVTTVFAGDRIATASETTTSLSFPGGDAVLLSQLSKASMAESSGRTLVKLEDGTLSALNKSATPIVVYAGGARISSVGKQPAVYDIFLNGNSLRVISRGGIARIETANKMADLEPGSELDATLDPPQPGPAIGAGMATAEVWIVVAAVAAGVTGMVLGVVAIQKTNNCHLSPSSNSIVC